MKTTVWIAKNVLLPLSPFFVGALIRVLHTGRLTLDSMNPAELSFSMAMMSLVVSMTASKLTDQHLKDSITYMYQIALIIFLALFACAVFLQTDIEVSIEGVWRTAATKIHDGTNLTSADLPEQISKYKDILDRFRITILVLSLIAVPVTIISNKKYGLEDL
jgi:hypothetical protein